MSPKRAEALFQAAVDAIDAGDVATLTRLLARQPALIRARCGSSDPPYDGYFHGATLLHHVAGNPIRKPIPDNVVELTRALLDAGADVHAGCGGGPRQPATGGGTLLGLVASGAQVAEQGHAEALIDTLVAAGADVNRNHGECLWLALYHTVECARQRDVAGLLHARGAEADLCYAAGLGRLDLVGSFFDGDGFLKAESEALYRHHRRPGPAATEAEILQDALLFAAVNGRGEVADFLLDHGADVNAIAPFASQRITPLQGAVWAGWLGTARRLHERGADPTIRDEVHRTSAVGWAIHCRRDDVLAYFLQDDSNLDLVDATGLGRLDRVRALLGEQHPDEALGPGHAGVLLRIAAHEGQLAVVRLLLERGAAPDLAGEDGKSALALARERGHDAVAGLLDHDGAGGR